MPRLVELATDLFLRLLKNLIDFEKNSLMAGFLFSEERDQFFKGTKTVCFGFALPAFASVQRSEAVGHDVESEFIFLDSDFVSCRCLGCDQRHLL